MKLARIGLLIFTLFFTAAPGFSANTQWWRSGRTEDFLKGRGEGVAITTDGRLEAVSTWRSLLKLEEPVLVAAAQAPDGDLLLLTGHPGRLYKLHGKSVEKLADLPAEQGTALTVDSAGAVWITTMAPGVLLRWKDGRLEEKGRLGKGGFWDVVEFDHSIIVAAGPPAMLFRLDEKGLERWAEVPDSFVRCLAVGDGKLFAGSSGTGLVLSFDGDGRPSLAVDSPFSEISDILLAPSGDLWVLALVGEPAEISPSKDSGKGAKKKSAGGGTVSLDLDLPKVGGKTAVSEVLRMTPEGALLQVHRFVTQVAGTLALDGDGILVGTGYEGEVWRFTDDGGARIASLDAIQAVAITPQGRYLLSQGPAAVFERRMDGSEHSFRSEAKHFKHPVRFGRFQVASTGGKTSIRFRQGGGSAKNPVWLDWGPWLSGSEGASGMASGRVVQWEVRLGKDDSIAEVSLATREINLPPQFRGVHLEEPGLIYLSSPPMGGAVISEDHPTLDGIFTVIGTPPEKSAAAKNGKKYWQIGYRTLSWEVSDPNRDPLRFDVELESEDGMNFPVRQDLKLTQLAVDMRAIPDGRYRFRVSASDEAANPGSAETVSRLSPWFEVDNTAPEIQMKWNSGRAQISVSDSSPILRVEVSEDGGAWRGLEPGDHLLDGGREDFVLQPSPGSRVLLCRAFDQHHNRSAAALRKVD